MFRIRGWAVPKLRNFHSTSTEDGNLRLAEAQKRLRETNDSIAIIAKSVGFNDTGHFCRTFKKETSLTPLQYRKSAS